jgi:hypothetical protein
MGISAAKNKTTTPAKGDPVKTIELMNIRNKLVASLAGLGWRMAIMVATPIFIGVKLDEKFNTKPSYSLAAFFIAIAGSGYLIYQAYHDIETERLEEEALVAKTNKSKSKKTKETK